MPRTVISTLMNDLDTGVGNFVSLTFGALSTATQPLFQAMFVLFIMLYGIALYWGYVKGTMGEAFKHVFIAVLIWGLLTNYSNLYFEFIVTPFTQLPKDVAGTIVGAQPIGGGSAGSINTYLDAIWEKFVEAGARGKGYFLKYIISAILNISAIISVGYGVILIAISTIALSLLLGLAPLFIIGLLFKSTNKFFEAWMQKCFNYMLVPILTYGALLIPVGIIDIKLNNLVATTGGVTIGSAFFVLFVSILCFVVLMQVMQISAGLAGGLSLSTMNVVAGAQRRAMGAAKWLNKRDNSKSGKDSYTKQASAGMKKLWGNRRRNKIVKA